MLHADKMRIISVKQQIYLISRHPFSLDAADKVYWILPIYQYALAVYLYLAYLDLAA